MTSSTPNGEAKAGDPAAKAIPMLLDAYGDRLYALGLRLCGSAADAEDLMQETFMQAFRKWDQYEGRSAPFTWLYTIATRACYRLHRKRAGEPARIGSLDELLPFGETRLAALPADDDVLGAQIQAEARSLVEAAIAALPVGFRLPLVLKDIVGLSIAEIARILDLKPATVKTRVHRARLRLRQALDEAIPRREGPAPPVPYSRQMCLDLLATKQRALDTGVPFDEEIICERCRTVFRELDMAQSACRDLARGTLPETVRRRIIGRIEDASDNGSESASQKL